MSGIFQRRDQVSKTDDKHTRRKKKLIKGTTIFIILMLLWPVTQFLITWIGVNFNSLLLTFKNTRGDFYSMSKLFNNYVNVFKDFTTQDARDMYAASAAYIVLNCFITLPLSLFISYFIFKKIYAAGFFKAIFYLPCVLPIVALTLVFQLSFTDTANAKGFMAVLFNAMSVRTTNWFMGGSAKWMVWAFCLWTGIGYDTMLLTAGMSRIPRELLESSKMDEIPPFKEFIYVVIPLTWPTITTLFIFAMMGFFGTFLQPMLLTQGQYQTMTLGLQIFYQADAPAKNYAATMGLIWTLIGSPIILGVRSLLNHFFKEVNF